MPLKENEQVKITWTDGDTVEGYFYKEDRGFILVKNMHDHNRIVPCHPSNCKIERINASEQTNRTNRTKST